MANLQKIIKVTQAQYDILASGGTVGDYTGLDENYIYLVEDNGSIKAHEITWFDFSSSQGQQWITTAQWKELDTYDLISFTIADAESGQAAQTVLVKVHELTASSDKIYFQTVFGSQYFQISAEHMPGTTSLGDALVEWTSSQFIQTIQTASGSHINTPGTPNVTVTNSGSTTTLTFDYLKGATGATGPKGNDGLTTQISVNGTTYTQSSGLITLPNYPTKTSDLTNDSGYITSHQSIKTLKTDNTTAQSPSSSETISGSGTINLHKVSKTGDFSDLLRRTANFIDEPGNYYNTPTLTFRPFIYDTAGNRMYGINYKRVIVEESVDAGQTWTVRNLTEVQKNQLFDNSNGGGQAFPKINGQHSCNAMLRVTCSAANFGSAADEATDANKLALWTSENYVSNTFYCNCDRFYVYIGGPNYCDCWIQTAPAPSSGTEPVFTNRLKIDLARGWNGGNTASTTSSFVLGGSKTQAPIIRFVFRVNSSDGQYDDSKLNQSSSNFNIMSIRLLGNTIWGTSNSMMQFNTPYKEVSGFPFLFDWYGTLRPSSNATYNLGGNDRKWNQIHSVTIYENGASLADKYLGKTAKAADSDKLDGNDSTYYLNYNNLTNKPTIPTESTVSGWGFTKNTGTITGVSVNGTSVATSGVAALTNIAKTNADNEFTGTNTFGDISTGDITAGDITASAIGADSISTFSISLGSYNTQFIDGGAWGSGGFGISWGNGWEYNICYDSSEANALGIIMPNGGGAYIKATTTNQPTLTLPTASGTLALTSDIHKIYEHNIIMTLSQANGTTGKLCCSFKFINTTSTAYSTHASLVTAMYNAGYNSSSHYIAASGEYSVPGGSQISGYRYSVIGLYYTSASDAYPGIKVILTGTYNGGNWTINDTTSSYSNISVYGGTTPTIVDNVRAL